MDTFTHLLLTYSLSYSFILYPYIPYTHRKRKLEYQQLPEELTHISSLKYSLDVRRYLWISGFLVVSLYDINIYNIIIVICHI